MVEEISGGAVQRTYTYGRNLISQTQVGSATTSFYGDNGLGSVRLLTDASGTKTDSYDYDAFGNLLASTGTTANNYRFAGEQNDPSLGLYYLRARYYNAGVGRFWTRDTAEINPDDPREINRYAYTADNPVNAVDPNGLALVDFAKLQAQVLARISAVAATGAALADNIARVLARAIQYPFSRQTVQQATKFVNFNLLRQATGKTTPRLSIVDGVYRTISGQAQRIIAVNNFYGDKRIYDAHAKAIEYLRNLVGPNNFIGGQYGNNLHAEQNFVTLAQRLPDIERVNGIARVMGGSSNVICLMCQSLGQWDAVRGVLEVIGTDMKIFIGGIIR